MQMIDLFTVGVGRIGMPHEEASSRHLVTGMNLAAGSERFSCRTRDAADWHTQELMVDGVPVCLMSPVWADMGAGFSAVIALHFCQDERETATLMATVDDGYDLFGAGPAVFGLDDAERAVRYADALAGSPGRR